MEDLKQNPDATQEEEVKEEGESTQEETQDDESQKEATPASEEKKEEELDYKEELRKTQEKLKKAEFTLYKKNKEDRQNKPSDEEDDDIDDRLEAIAQAKREAKEELLQSSIQDNLDGSLDKYGENPDRQTLIKYHYENSIRHSGYSKKDIESDLEVAAMIADKPLIEKRMEEIKKSIESQKTKSTGGESASVDIDEQAEIALTERDKAFMRRHNLSQKDIINNSK